jgi:pyruvate formate lyase activating enzyme
MKRRFADGTGQRAAFGHTRAAGMASSGVVFNIQRFSLHDGPGIRTTVFLKGCPLSCFWCHNPEGRHAYAELQYHPDRCIACGACVQACPHSAHELRDGVHLFHRERCRNSFDCVATCYSNALEIAGREMTSEEVIEEVLRDRPFYHEAGGITLSGGEPAPSLRDSTPRSRPAGPPRGARWKRFSR